MHRRELLIRVGGTLLAVPAALLVTGCSSGGDDDAAVRVDAGRRDDAASGAGSFDGTNDRSDGSGHTHTFTVQCADLSGSGASYTAVGSGHTHAITLDALQLATLAGGQTVTFATSSLHAHTWSVTKPASVC